MILNLELKKEPLTQRLKRKPTYFSRGRMSDSFFTILKGNKKQQVKDKILKSLS